MTRHDDLRGSQRRGQIGGERQTDTVLSIRLGGGGGCRRVKDKKKARRKQNEHVPRNVEERGRGRDR